VPLPVSAGCCCVAAAAAVAAELTGAVKTTGGAGVTPLCCESRLAASCPCTFCAEVGGGEVRAGPGRTVRDFHSFSKAFCVRKERMNGPKEKKKKKNES